MGTLHPQTELHMAGSWNWFEILGSHHNHKEQPTSHGWKLIWNAKWQWVQHPMSDVFSGIQHVICEQGLDNCIYNSINSPSQVSVGKSRSPSYQTKPLHQKPWQGCCENPLHPRDSIGSPGQGMNCAQLWWWYHHAAAHAWENHWNWGWTWKWNCVISRSAGWWLSSLSQHYTL